MADLLNSGSYYKINVIRRSILIMKLDRKVIESGVVLSAAVVLTAFATISQPTATTVTEYTVETQEIQSGDQTASVVAGVFSSLESMVDTDTVAAINSTATIEDTSVTQVASAEEPAENSEWSTRLMANVDDYANIRSDASADSELVGKLYKGDAAEILEQGDEWTKISSGSVEGYVKNEYVAFGDDAQAIAEEEGTWTATSTTGGLRIRTDASADASVAAAAEEGQELEIDTSAEPVEGWTAVVYNDQTCYVSSEYVNRELVLGEAISIEEEQAELKAQQEAEAAEAAKKASQKSTTASTTQGAGVAASCDDTTLLAALIQCEAGSESYEGQVAVGACVINRVNSGSYAGSISGVIYQSGQFTPASSGKLASVLSSGNISSSCYSAAQAAISGTSNIGSATSFGRTGSASGTVIGNHVFY